MEGDPRSKKKRDVTVNMGQKPPQEEWVSEQVTAAGTWGSRLRGISALTMEHNSDVSDMRVRDVGRFTYPLHPQAWANTPVETDPSG